MKYTVAQLKKMNTERLANLIIRVNEKPKSKTRTITLRRANRILENRVV